MDKTQLTRPKRVKNPPVQSPEVLEPATDDSGNKYAQRTKIGKPTVGVPNRVERVGLGNLKVITTNGYTDVRSD